MILIILLDISIAVFLILALMGYVEAVNITRGLLAAIKNNKLDEFKKDFFGLNKEFNERGIHNAK